MILVVLQRTLLNLKYTWSLIHITLINVIHAVVAPFPYLHCHPDQRICNNVPSPSAAVISTPLIGTYYSLATHRILSLTYPNSESSCLILLSI
jgi:hypothetical protein